MTDKEQLLQVLEKLLKPVLMDSEEVNYGLPQKKGGTKEGIEFRYKGCYVRIEIK